MAHETRTSEQGTVFDAATVRDFLLKALGHDTVIDQVNELLFDHVMKRQYHSSVVAESLKPIIDEVLGVAVFEDWDWVAQALTAEACEALGNENPLDRTPGAQPQKTQTRRCALKNLDPGELREKLAEIYTQQQFSLRRALLAEWMIRKINGQTGISRKQIKADAKADAQALRAVDHDTAAEDNQRGAHTPARTETLEVNVSLPEKLVRALSRDEALALMHIGEQSEDPLKRRRAAILIASNVGCTTSQIAAMHAIDATQVQQIITAFNARGMDSLDVPLF